MITFGQKIRLKRREAGLTQKELSSLCGIAQPNLSNIEKDACDVTVASLKRMAHALKVRPSELIDDAPAQPNRTVFSRDKIERIAEAVVGGWSKGLTEEEAKLVRLFKQLLPRSTSAYVSLNGLHDAWLQLREVLNKKEIDSIYKRIQDAQARQ